MKETLKYYNYVSFYRGIPVYVGKGSGDRWQHTLHGQSNSEKVNDFYFRKRYLNDMPLDTYIVERFKTEASALRGENKLIDGYRPYANKCRGRVHTCEYVFRDKLEGLCKSLGFGSPEKLHSKFDFRFLFTPLGLLCKGVILGDKSPFEYAELPYHIRLKSDLFRGFPEYFLQFMPHDPRTSGDNLTAVHTKGFYMRHYEMCLFDEFNGCDYGEDWVVDAISGESFNFAEEFGFVSANFNLDRYLYHKSLREEHVLCRKRHLADVVIASKLKDSQKEKLVDFEKRKSVGLVSASECFGSSEIRVKETPSVLSKLKSAGFDISGQGAFINLSEDVRPFKSISALSRYKLIKEEEFISGTLSGLRTC